MFAVIITAALMAPCATSQKIGLHPNQFWRCNNCDEQISAKSTVYANIRKSFSYWQRNTYTALNTDWVDDLLAGDAKVAVSVVKPNSLVDTFMPHPGLPDTKEDEVFQLLYVPYSVDDPFQYLNIDIFLMNNPCWIPVHEPMIPELAFLESADVRRRKRTRLRHRTLAEKSDLNHHEEETYAEGLNSFAVFARLPVYGFQATCRLFSLIQQAQFPERCIYDEDHMFNARLSNIGWSSAFYSLLGFFTQPLVGFPRKHKMTVAPGAQPFRAETYIAKDAQTGEMFNKTLGWGWINARTCPLETRTYDPWACNFISFTNCTRPKVGGPPIQIQNESFFPVGRDLHAIVPLNEGKMVGFDTEFDYSKFGSGEKHPSLQQVAGLFQDGSYVDAWDQQREFAYLQRPNYVLRRYIAESLYSVQRIFGEIDENSPAQHIHHHKAHAHAHARPPHAVTHTVHHRSPSSIPQPCLALHIRHGDAHMDSRVRSEAGQKMDRSLEGHMKLVFPLVEQLGIRTIFLATDDEVVVKAAPLEYPQFHWYSQKRPIKDFSGAMFEMHNEDDMQKELAHVLADLRAGATCQAIVGSFDSAFAAQMLMQSCTRDKRSNCPPSEDLRNYF